MKRLARVTCLLIAGIGSLGITPGGTVSAAPSPCGKGNNLCFVAGAAGSTWTLTLYGSKLQAGTYVTFSYSSLEGGSAGAVLVPKGGSVKDVIGDNGPCPAIAVNAVANGTTSKGGAAAGTYSSPAVC